MGDKENDFLFRLDFLDKIRDVKFNHRIAGFMEGDSPMHFHQGIFAADRDFLQREDFTDVCPTLL